MNKERLKSILELLFFVFILSWFFYAIWLRILLEANHRYTIATTLNKNYANGATWISYSYEVNGNMYESTQPEISTNRINLGTRYFVKFNPDDPSNSEIHWDQPVPDHPDMQKAPDAGWQKIPIKYPD